MISVKDIVQYSELVDRYPDRNVAVKVVKNLIGSDENGKYKLIRGSTLAETRRHKYWIKVYFNKQGRVTSQSKCWVHCDCERFLFKYEVALKRVGSTSIINSNGRRPFSTNPGLRPGACKHINAILQKAILREPVGEVDDKELGKIPSKSNPTLIIRAGEIRYDMMEGKSRRLRL